MAEKESEPKKQGQLEPITYGPKVIAVKRKCSCGGDVDIHNNPDGPGKVATCRQCGATMTFGGA